MGNKLISIIAITILCAGIFTAIMTVVYAKSSGLACSKGDILVTLKDKIDIDTSKKKILGISKIKITKTTNRDKEWSKMVNKYDLPKMENPFKNEFVIKIKKNADIDEIINKIQDMDFVEKVEYNPDKEYLEK